MFVIFTKLMCWHIYSFKQVTIIGIKPYLFFDWYIFTLVYIHNLATTCDFQLCGILTSVDSDEPVQSPVMLRNSKLCSFSSLTVIEYSSN